MGTVLITGTDTGVGKTALALGLTAYWQRYRPQQTVGLLKLLACGPDDPLLYQQILTLDQPTLCPINFTAPIAPPLAAQAEGTTVDLSLLWAEYSRLKQLKDQVFVEAVGGLGCPLTEDYTVADLAKDWRVPIVLVAPVRLGVLGQLVTHCRYAYAEKLPVVGIVLSQVEPCSETQTAQWAPQDLIERLCGLPVLGIFPHVAHWTADSLAEATRQLDLEYLLVK